jgi:predicted nucleic acid-binding protein
MNITLDTSIVIAVITNEPIKPKILDATAGAELIAPDSIHWEIGNAFSALFKKRMINLEQAKTALKIYDNIPIRFVSIDLEPALVIASKYEIYAYDAYVIECALKHKSPLITLDSRLIDFAKKNSVEVIQIK